MEDIFAKDMPLQTKKRNTPYPTNKLRVISIMLNRLVDISFSVISSSFFKFHIPIFLRID